GGPARLIPRGGSRPHHSTESTGPGRCHGTGRDRRRMANTDHPSTRLRGVPELIATLPYQLGYQPERSLVVTLLRRPPGGPQGAARLHLTFRVDLPSSPADHRELCDRVVDLVRRERADAAQLLAFEDGRDSTELLRWLADGCDLAGVLVDCEARVRQGRWLRLREPDGSAPR